MIELSDTDLDAPLVNCKDLNIIAHMSINDGIVGMTDFNVENNDIDGDLLLVRSSSLNISVTDIGNVFDFTNVTFGNTQLVSDNNTVQCDNRAHIFMLETKFFKNKDNL